MEELGQLIKDCTTGKSKAQARLYQLFAPKMYGVCLRYSRDTNEAEDNLQDGFIKVFDKIGSFRHDGSFEGWIHKIMVNVALEKFRKTSILLPVEDLTEFEINNSNDEIIEGISANDLLELIQQLSSRYRMVFNLYVIDGMSHKEIADEMGITEGTSKSNLARARGILKKKIMDYFGLTENIYSA